MMPPRKRSRKVSVSDHDTAAASSVSGNITTENSLPAKQDDHASQPPKKKRKSRTGAASQSKKKKVVVVPPQDSSILGRLCADVLIEICSYLRPLDLLHLSWTSKGLNKFLTCDSMALVWRKARTENIVEGIPDCPSWITEPLYANLMFSEHCFYCLKEYKRDEMNLSWGGRFRTCNKCVKKKALFMVIDKGEEDSSDWSEDSSDSSNDSDEAKEVAEWSGGYPKDVFIKCLPSFRLPFGRSRTRKYYHVSTHNRWKQEYQVSVDKQQWRDTKLKEREAILEHTNRCEDWMEDYEEYLIVERQNMVLKRIELLGWKQELDRLPRGDSRHPLRDFIIADACDETLREADLVKLEPHINTMMGGLRAKWAAIDRRNFLGLRIRALVAIVKTCRMSFPPNALIPNVGDVFFVPRVLDIINSTPEGRDFTQDDLLPLIEAYPDLAQQWRRDKEAELVEMIRSSHHDDESYSFSPDTVLRLATTMFSCKHCLNSDVPLWYPRVLVHRDAIRRSCPEDASVDMQIVFSYSQSTPWNANKAIGFLKDESLIMANVLKEFGFDPLTTTADEMDELDPIFECVTCNDRRRGRFTMKWTHLAHHISSIHKDISNYPYKIEMLQGEAASSVRDRFAEDNSFDRGDDIAYLGHKSTICVHCRAMGTPVNMFDHVVRDHQIANPTDADLVRNLDIVPPKQFRYSFPARKTQSKS